MHISLLRCLPLLAAASLPLSLSAQTVYLDENFDGGSLGSTVNVAQVTVTAGSGAIGTDNVANFNDVNSGGGDLEYNLGLSPVSDLYVSFDIQDIGHSGTGSGASPVIFGIGPWSTASGTLLGSNANRAFNIEFMQTGTTSTLKLRVNSTSILNTTYDTTGSNHVEVWVNDNDSTPLSYIRPDTSVSALLAANSFVVFINGSLLATETESGFTMNTSGNGNTTGDATLGRLGFNTSTTTVANFYIDNLYASSVPSAVPEPATYALLGGIAALGLAIARRRRQR